MSKYSDTGTLEASETFGKLSEKVSEPVVNYFAPDAKVATKDMHMRKTVLAQVQKCSHMLP